MSAAVANPTQRKVDPQTYIGHPSVDRQTTWGPGFPPNRNIKWTWVLYNCMSYLFEEIRYEINGIEIYCTRKLGVATEIKNYVSLNEFESKNLKNAGWCPFENINLKTGHFNFCIPLKNLLGFAEDFDKIIVNCKHELVLIRAKEDDCVMKTTTPNEKLSLKLLNITWKVPHIQLSDSYRLTMLRTINSKQPLNISFRSWDVYHNPSLEKSMNNLWNVKIVGENEGPRDILLGFQNEKKFKHCDLLDAKVHLNCTTSPYDDLYIKLERNRYALLYDMYLKFQQSYYGRTSQALLSPNQFVETAPIIVLDVKHQNEFITSKEGLSSDVTEHFILSQSQMVYSFEISLWID